MCNVSKLKGKITEKGLNQSQFAQAIGMSRATLNRKLKTGEDFTIEEAGKIVCVLELSGADAVEIFFNLSVA